MDENALIRVGIRSLESLAPTLARLQQDDRPDAAITAALKRGYFKPDEEQHLRAWFALYLTARSGLLETIGDLRPIALPDRWDLKSTPIDDATHLKCFAIAYAATGLLVQAARFLIGEIATHKITQRKLNEASPLHRIPSRQYTIIYRSMTHPLNAWRINEAMNFADAHRADLEALADDPKMKPVLGYIQSAEDALRVGVATYFRARLHYRWHSWRRRRASAVQRAMFSILETCGRLVADKRYWGQDRPMDREVFDALSELLKPGDVIVMRHDHALTNLFLPGFWPHVGLHVGTESERESLGVSFNVDRSRRAVDPARVLEAKKDGVLFRPLAETLTVDSVAIIRPTLDVSDIAEAISRAASHEGKLYNFDFDFFNDEKLVCTEVVYRAYDGVGSMHFDLSSRAGKMTISAEDLLDMAVEGRGFEPVAVFGAPGCEKKLVQGPLAHDALARTYREKESL